MPLPSTQHLQRPCDRCGAPTETALCPACRRRLSSGLAEVAEEHREAPEAPVVPKPPPAPTRTIGVDLTGAPEVVSVEGSLYVEGRVGSGWRLEAVDTITVEGMIDGADLLAGLGAVRLEAGCNQCDVRAGVARAYLQRAGEALLGVEEDIAMVVRMTTELRLAAAMRGTAIPVRHAFEVVLTARAADLPGRLDAALTILRAGRDRAGTALDPLLTAVSTARTALASETDLKAVARLGGDLAQAIGLTRWFTGQAPRSLVDSLNRCEAEFAGDLVLRGQGAKDCELTVNGDLMAATKGTTIQGGTTRVSGRTMVDRLGGGPSTQVVIEGTMPGERLRASSVASGVEILAGDRTFAFASERKDLVIKMAHGRAEMLGA